MNIIFFGPPGVGKGTQAERTSERLGIPHISTGAIFREAITNGTELGRKAKEYMDQGTLVPDELTNALVVEALDEQKNGFILDGFPRNLEQARALHAALQRRGRSIDHIVYLTAPREVIVERMLSRGRSDDNEEVIRTRLNVYENETFPVLDFYRDKGTVSEVNGVGEIEIIQERILSTIGVSVGE